MCLQRCRPIGLLNVGIQLLHHVINYRLTVITQAEMMMPFICSCRNKK